MIEQKYGPRRCRDSRKPLAEQSPDVIFYRCPECRRVLVSMNIPNNTRKEADGVSVACCGAPAVRMVSIDAESAIDRIQVDYQITGGYNDNAVRVSWKAEKPENLPEWIYLKTFTGGYLKYAVSYTPDRTNTGATEEHKRPPMVFALADTDAFAYCDEDPCLECVFRCKRGFIIYVCTRRGELIEVPLDRMTAHWQTGAK